MPEELWDKNITAFLDDRDALVSRSRLIGSDPTLVNYGGGNTSAKLIDIDHVGREVETLWIKGSGFDLGSIERKGFARLKLPEVRLLQSREEMTDGEMIDYLGLCAFGPGFPQPSIETLLHAFLPFPHVDHTHAEAALGFCCSHQGREMTAECFGSEIAWVPYVRPGFGLAKLAMEVLNENPSVAGMFLAKHGLVTWGETGRESYRRTVDVVARAGAWLEDKVDEARLFGGQRSEPPSPQQRKEVMARLLPVIRGELIKGKGEHLILHWDDSPHVLHFTSSVDMETLSQTGAPTPDHVLFTKFLPCAVELEAPQAFFVDGDLNALQESVLVAISSYTEAHQSFFARHREPDVELLDTGPRILLMPGLGMIAVGSDSWAAANTASLYRSAIRVMRWASSASTYESLNERERWEIEYWPLELRKLTLRPKPKELAGHIAVITGGAGGIGKASASRLLREDAHIVLADVDEDAAKRVASDLSGEHPTRALGFASDASNEQDVENLIRRTVLAFGGVDIVVPNAGVSSAGPIDETDLVEWERVHNLMVRGYFLACRAAFRVMKRQGTGGVIVINGSKNGLASGKNAIAYTTAKAAKHHMARCLAEEGGQYGIRVNAVAPDAVIRGSGIWNKAWVEQRAKAYGFKAENVEEYYRQRNALRVTITAEDVAEAILFLASARSSKTTGCVVTIDGGLGVAYPR